MTEPTQWESRNDPDQNDIALHFSMKINIGGDANRGLEQMVIEL